MRYTVIWAQDYWNPQECLCRELELRGLSFERQKPLPLEYKEIKLDCGYRIDIVVETKVVLELKCVDTIASVHEAANLFASLWSQSRLDSQFLRCSDERRH